MFVLDSDTLTLSLQGNPKIARRISAARDAEIYLPTIVVEEQY